MRGTKETPRGIAETMLASVDPSAAMVAGGRERFVVTIGGETITVGDGEAHAFERLASALETRIAYERAIAMIAATGETGVPLWLVAGPDMLRDWLAWSRMDKALARTLTLTDRAGAVPVTGRFARPTRRALGQAAIKVRVFGGEAVAERIDLSCRVPAVAVLAGRSTIRIARHQLPEPLLVALNSKSGSNGRPVSEIVSHPFFAAHDFTVAGVGNGDGDVVIELETSSVPLAPIPKRAWSAVPRDADPIFPWRATRRETAELYALARRGKDVLSG